MVSRQVLAVILAAFGAISGPLMSDRAASPEGASSSPASAIVVKRFKKKPLPVVASQESPGQVSAEGPLHCALDQFASGTDNPIVGPPLEVVHSPEPALVEPSADVPCTDASLVSSPAQDFVDDTLLSEFESPSQPAEPTWPFLSEQQLDDDLHSFR